jgi:hypothetical protein
MLRKGELRSAAAAPSPVSSNASLDELLRRTESYANTHFQSSSSPFYSIPDPLSSPPPSSSANFYQPSISHPAPPAQPTTFKAAQKKALSQMHDSELRKLKQEMAEERARKKAREDEDRRKEAARRFDYAAHERAFQKLVESAASNVPYAAIPWLPEGCPASIFAGSDEDVQAALKRAAIRWHPDRFEGVLGARLAPGDREAILARVTETSQAVNALRRSHK